MSLLRSIMSGSSKPAPSDDFWFTNIGQQTASGVRVSPESALRQSDVYKCVNILSQTLASTPLILYRSIERGKERAKEHPLYTVLKKRPNDNQTAYEFKQYMMMCLALRGVSYNEITSGPRGAVDQLTPIHPDRVKPERLPNGKIQYRVTDDTAGERILLGHQMFSVLGLSLDGINPISPIEYHRETVGNGLTALHHGGRILANDGTPPIAIHHPGHFKDDEQFNQFKNRWKRNQTGANKGSVAVLEHGMKIEKIGMSNKDMEYIEIMKFTRSDIFGIFRIPLILSGEGDKTQTYASAEQFFLSFIKFTMLPWFTNVEQAADRDLVVDGDSADFFPEFLTDVWMRGDSQARSSFYNEGLSDGWLTRNEVRQMENRNPLPGLDEPLQMMNMAGADRLNNNNNQDQKSEAAKVARSEIVAVTEAYDRFELRSEFNKWCAEYYGKFRKMIRASLGIDIKTANQYCMSSFNAITGCDDVKSFITREFEAERADYLYQLSRLSE